MNVMFLAAPVSHTPTPPKRNLGNAILLAAIEDYRSLHPELHQSAKLFLFPPTAEWQNHFEWVISMTSGVNPAWLRDALDRAKSKWDKQRFARMREARRGV
jgi:hypothetical protein